MSKNVPVKLPPIDGPASVAAWERWGANSEAHRAAYKKTRESLDAKRTVSVVAKNTPPVAAPIVKPKKKVKRK